MHDKTGAFQSVKVQENAVIWSIGNNASRFHTYHKHFHSNQHTLCVLIDPKVPTGLLNSLHMSLLPQLKRSKKNP